MNLEDHNSEREPLHPHPLSNDLITESLPARSPAEVRSQSASIGPAPRRVLKVVGAIVGVLALMALVAAAFLFRDQRHLILIGFVAVFLYFVILSTPILLAAGTKEVQDESVRDANTPARVLHRRP